MAGLPASILERLRLPLIAAPMLHVSGPQLVSAACRAGVIGAFPTANARDAEGLDRWLTGFEEDARRAEQPVAPHAPNLIIRSPKLQEHLAVLIRHRVELVITSVGSPRDVVKPLHDVGALVFSDVASLVHAKKAIEAGADGLVLLTAGAGGQTGWLNPFVFVRAVRGFFDGPLVMAGGIIDGHALHAATVLGCDLGYMGTRFIAAEESLASDEYRQMLVASNADDVLLTKAFTGLQTNMLRPAIVAAGLDPDRLDEQLSVPDAQTLWGGSGAKPGPKRWKDIFSAGHSVSGVTQIEPAAALIARTEAEYHASRSNPR